MTEPTTAAGREAWRRLIDRPTEALLAFDFDGTLAPIVDDPEQAHVHPEALSVLGRLGPRLGVIAIITGRPVRSVLRLGRFADAPGLDRLRILGQYGVERWRADTGRIEEPPPPEGIAVARERLPALLAELGLAAVHLEDKGRAIGVHVRRMADPDAALDRLREPLRQFAADLGLTVEPGRMVMELRGPGVDKGEAIRSLVEEVDAGVVAYAGDDLGDVAAFDAVAALRADPDGPAGVLICPASAEQPALAARADVVVDGPDGLIALLTELADALDR
ncbi:MAG TPA: trehalose-phosphatase [Nocardioidaceae bacterium]|nr:trehalose-phosphatase [Nocardioidaceae bacterium]